MSASPFCETPPSMRKKLLTHCADNRNAFSQPVKPRRCILPIHGPPASFSRVKARFAELLPPALMWFSTILGPCAPAQQAPLPACRPCFSSASAASSHCFDRIPAPHRPLASTAHHCACCEPSFPPTLFLSASHRFPHQNQSQPFCPSCVKKPAVH